jgi:hypothetical protein
VGVTRWLFLPALGGLAVVLAAGCSTGAVGVDACKKIEEARCRQAPSCPSINLDRPYAASGTSVDACIRYYDIDCLHGLDIGSEPTGSQVAACVLGIQTDGCAVVAKPETDPVCAWLLPAASEAGADADDGATDGAADGDGDDGG